MNYSRRERYGCVIMVVGMQYGSEGKGAITSYLAPVVSMGVRTGASNAGHTIYYQGQRYVMRQLPAVWTTPMAKLVIGVGSIISLDVLLEELSRLSRIVSLDDRVYVDLRAHVVTPKQIALEQQTDLGVRIGSTSARSAEGIGAATAQKVMRAEDCLLAADVPELQPYLADTVELINRELDNDGYILLEGTQGFGLSLEHGMFPYTTSRDVSAAATAASAGIAMHEFPVDVVGVVRTYPIRVAGNSGPFGDDCEETTWEEITRRSGAVEPILERTTVTGLPRRVAGFSEREFGRTCRVNRPTELAVTFADYLDWRVHGTDEITLPVEAFIERVEELAGCPVGLVQTGPQTTVDLDCYRATRLRQLR